MLQQDLADTETDFSRLESKLSEVYSYLGGIPARELYKTLQSGQGMSVVYQPQVNVADDQVSTVEALVRWHHPTVGSVSPRVFIPIAEETGLILQVTEFVIREACSVAKRRPDLTVAVNLSPLLFAHSALIERFVKTVEECGVTPHQIEFEITENQPLAGDGSARESIAFLRDCGFRIALDDFGIGYSGVQRLNHIGVDKLKIDQSFVRRLDCLKSEPSHETIQQMIEVGRTMDLVVTAEGVETDEQRRFLASAGCDALQGYLFARPMAARDLDAFLGNRARVPVAA
ncbi:EAL domain-containing protein [Microvirga sp. VF16]|uniref:EAL domain-containing protein n=1 Tax=Microvirga sp. VF16 TaxID=2807101 RepID=UPI00193DBDCB|nr:EAL domain-containing protein [Microvirga sp. VF16]QRM34894.1 EAL domain-containing protein [Microvirga sp. VF16]